MPNEVLEATPVQRVVIKVGTHVITNKDERIVGKILGKLVDQIAYLYEHGIHAVLFS